MPNRESPRTIAATVGLRPPRIAVLFRGDDHWRAWARLAIHTASRHWGGEGYVLVPYDPTGSIVPDIAEAVAKFDPDYVALMTHSHTTWNEVAPDVVTFTADSTMSPEMLERALDSAPMVADAAGRKAAATLALRCSTLAYPGAHRGPQIKHLRLGEPPRESSLLAAPRVGVTPMSCLTGSTEWDSPLALWAGARVGIAELGGGRPVPDEVELLRWCIDPAGAHPPRELAYGVDEDVDSISTEHPPWFHAANPDLAMIRGGFVEDAGAVVIGDTPEDFSMAMIYDRTIGFAIWLTLDAVELLSNNWMLAERLRLRATDNAVQPSLATVSMSLAPPQLEPIIRSILAAIDLPELEDESPAEGDWLEMREPVATQDALLSLMLANEVGEVVSLAASEQTGGTVELATGLSAPIPTDPPLTGLGSPAWLVDVATPENQMPRARRVDAGCLAVDSKFELLRSSRAGITFHAASHGFIPSNTVLRSRLARPRLRFPGLADWINARARDGGMVPRLSRPGQNSALVAQRLGGRDAMTGLLAGPLRAGLQYAAQPGGSSRSDFPKEDGVVLHGVRMLTFDAFAEFAVGAGRAEVRSILDQLLVGRLMRRGIVLDCPDCHTPSFVSIDELGQVVNCARCEARNQLTAARWRSPADEPVWFYDLHPALGELLCANGDVSALVAREFKARAARRYFDVEELEFASMETGSTRFEIDLIALIDDELIVVESKSNGSLGSGRKRQRSVIKRFEAAVLLGADAVAFATTGGWSSDTVARVEEIRDTSFQQVRLSWLDGLGS